LPGDGGGVDRKVTALVGASRVALPMLVTAGPTVTGGSSLQPMVALACTAPPQAAGSTTTSKVICRLLSPSRAVGMVPRLRPFTKGLLPPMSGRGAPSTRVEPGT